MSRTVGLMNPMATRFVFSTGGTSSGTSSSDLNLPVRSLDLGLPRTPVGAILHEDGGFLGPSSSS